MKMCVGGSASCRYLGDMGVGYSVAEQRIAPCCGPQTAQPRQHRRVLTDGPVQRFEYQPMESTGRINEDDLMPWMSLITIQEEPWEPKVTNLYKLQHIGYMGQGSFGTVSLVSYKGGLYALKRMNKIRLSEADQLQSLETELELLQSFQHDFIIKLFGTFADTNCLYMLLEPCLGGDLLSLVGRESHVDEETAKFYFACITLALAALQSQGYIHRDVKLDNILIDRNGYPRLIDFGFSKFLENDETFTQCGTVEYMSPEVIFNVGHGKPADWWAMGCVLYELVTGRHPFEYSPEKSVTGAIVWPDDIPLSQEIRNLLRGLLNISPEERYGPDQVVGHAWFTDFSWHDLKEHKIPAPFIPDLDSEIDLRLCYTKDIDDHVERFVDMYQEFEDLDDMFDNSRI